MSEKTLGQIGYEALHAAAHDDDTTAWTHPAVAWARPAWETAMQAVAAHATSRLDGLMPMGLRFDDADPVAVCLVGDCKWHAHGDAMTDATRAWTAHLAEAHRHDWPED